MASIAPPRVDQGQRPPTQPIEGSHGPGGHDVELHLAVHLLGPSPVDGHVVELHCGRRELQKRGATQQRLQQGDVQVGPAQREHQPGQPGARADVDDAGSLGHQVGDHAHS